MINQLHWWNVSNTMNLRQDDGGESEGRSPNIKALLVIGFIVIGRAGGYPLQTKSKHLFLMVWPSIIGTIIIPGHVSQEKSLQRDLVPSNGGKNWWSLLVYFEYFDLERCSGQPGGGIASKAALVGAKRVIGPGWDKRKGCHKWNCIVGSWKPWTRARQGRRTWPRRQELWTRGWRRAGQGWRTACLNIIIQNHDNN